MSRCVSWGRRIAAWLCVWLTLWQGAVAFAAQGAMPPIERAADGTITICTLAGMRVISPDGAPVAPPAHREAPVCPCCAPFVAGGVVVPVAAVATPPDQFEAFVAPIVAETSRAWPVLGNQQPRAPPAPF